MPATRLSPPRVHPGDVAAGLAVACLLIPQSLAYAELAGVPAYVGLYAAVLPPIVAALFASSPYLQTGPVAMTALLAFGALSHLAPARSADYGQVAALLALIVGVVRVAIGTLRWGWVAYLMSQPVMSGFTSAAALLIISTQVPTALGVVEPPSGNLLSTAWWAASHPQHWDPAAVVLSLATVGLVLGGRRLHPLFPGVLVAVVAAAAYSALAGYDGAVVGHVPSGLPPFSLVLPWERLVDLLVPGVVIALVGFAEPAAIARTLAAAERSRWSPDQEFVAQGLANLASGASGAFPVGGSFSRTSVNRLAGGRTRLSGAIAGLVVLAFLPVAWVLAPLPRAVLAAIVVAAVGNLVQLRPVIQVARFSLPQAAVMAGTFVATLYHSPRIERGVIIGVGLALAVHVWRELRVHVTARYADETLRLVPKGVLFFASAPGLEEALIDQLALHPQARRLVLDLHQLGRIDLTGAEALENVVTEATEAGLEVAFVGIPPHARRVLAGVFGESSPLLEDSRASAKSARTPPGPGGPI